MKQPVCLPMLHLGQIRSCADGQTSDACSSAVLPDVYKVNSNELSTQDQKRLTNIAFIVESEICRLFGSWLWIAS